MKTIYIFLFIALANSAYCQKNIIEQNALKWFKSVYVEENFKDPYSFKLLKISSIPQNTFETIRTDDIYPLFVELGIEKNDINATDTSIININIQVYKDLIKGMWEGNEDRIKYLKRIEKLLICKSNMMTLINISSNKVLKNKICRYGIYIDCYSNNSYGNKILGKFAFFYYPNGSLLYKSYEKYSYPNFMIDENTIVQLNKD